MAKNITLPELCELANWTFLWLSNLGNGHLGFKSRPGESQAEPYDLRLVARHVKATKHLWDELCDRGPLFVAAAGEWSDEIVTCRPSGNIAAPIGFVATVHREPREVVADSDLSVIHLLAKWVGDIGRGIAGRKVWQNAVDGRHPVDESKVSKEHLLEFVSRLCLNSVGIESIRMELERELAFLRVSSNAAIAAVVHPPKKSQKSGGRKAKNEKTTNEMMTEILETNPAAKFWTITEWEQATGRRKSTIQVTMQWRSLEKTRQAVRAEKRLAAAERSVGGNRVRR